MKKRKPHSSASSSTAVDSNVRDVLDSIRRVVRVLRLGSRSAEKQVGLSTAQLFVLQKLAEAELSVNEVAERTHTHQSSVSVVVQRLVDRGLVSRRRSRQDGRQMQLSATRAGHAILRLAPSPAQDHLIGAMARMTPPQLRQLANSLHRLVDLLGLDKDEPAAMLFEDESDSPRRAAPATRMPQGIPNRKARANGRP
jgi:MarR family transcriptional regulator, lower aerobic nicotinate degradation pathway regulator